MVYEPLQKPRRVAVFGSSLESVDGMQSDLDLFKDFLLENRWILITGMSKGTPQSFVQWTSKSGVVVEGYSPHENEISHVAFGDPIEGFSKINYLGGNFASNEERFKANAHRLVEAADLVLVVGGNGHTLDETRMAVAAGKTVALLSTRNGLALKEMLSKGYQIGAEKENVIIGTMEFLLSHLDKFAKLA